MRRDNGCHNETARRNVVGTQSSWLIFSPIQGCARNDRQLDDGHHRTIGWRVVVAQHRSGCAPQCGERPVGRRIPHRRRVRGQAPAAHRPALTHSATPLRHDGCMAEPDPLLGALRTLTGRPDAEFRDGQRRAISALVNDRGRVLVVQRTGWGKSAVYFITTHLLRRAGRRADAADLAAARADAEPDRRRPPARAALRDDQQRVGHHRHRTERQLRADEVDLLLISPERLANPEFGNKIMPIVGARPGLIVIDEVHCISDWGHDFRPDYRRIGRIVDRLGGLVRAGPRLHRHRQRPRGRRRRRPARRRPHHVPRAAAPGGARAQHDPPRPAGRAARLARRRPPRARRLGHRLLPHRARRRQRRRLARLAGHRRAAYFGALDTRPALEAETQAAEQRDQGAGRHRGARDGLRQARPRFVVHFQSPGSPVGYYQQVGRAGRALETSRGVLLRGREDEEIQDYFIEKAFAEEHLVRDIVTAFDSVRCPVVADEGAGAS